MEKYENKRKLAKCATGFGWYKYAMNFTTSERLQNIKKIDYTKYDNKVYAHIRWM